MEEDAMKSRTNSSTATQDGRLMYVEQMGNRKEEDLSHELSPTCINITYQ
jgi:hypothetical protein